MRIFGEYMNKGHFKKGFDSRRTGFKKGHPNYWISDSRVNITCDSCKKSFKDYPSNKRRFCSLSCSSKWNFSRRQGWGKKDKTEYKRIHEFISRTKGRPSFCTECGNTKKSRYHWANIDGKYTRDPNDYKALCVPCHYKFDMRGVQVG